MLGRYHPHGDASVYDAMVRLAQDFSMRYTLVDGHGNFGSVDGDPPAAYRYTEARMSEDCNEMLRDIEKDTVDWDPNFDESQERSPACCPAASRTCWSTAQPVSPSAWPPTSRPTTCARSSTPASACWITRTPTLHDLMEHIKGPDFPTSGIIMGRSGIRAAYATGRGKIMVRAPARV